MTEPLRKMDGGRQATLKTGRVPGGGAQRRSTRGHRGTVGPERNRLTGCGCFCFRRRLQESSVRLLPSDLPL